MKNQYPQCIRTEDGYTLELKGDKYTDGDLEFDAAELLNADEDSDLPSFQALEPAATEDLYFKSETARLIYTLIELDGEQRLKHLGIDAPYAKDSAKATELISDIAQKLHPDQCQHPHALHALTTLFRLHRELTGNSLELESKDRIEPLKTVNELLEARESELTEQARTLIAQAQLMCNFEPEEYNPLIDTFMTYEAHQKEQFGIDIELSFEGDLLAINEYDYGTITTFEFNTPEEAITYMKEEMGQDEERATKTLIYDRFQEFIDEDDCYEIADLSFNEDDAGKYEFEITGDPNLYVIWFDSLDEASEILAKLRSGEATIQGLNNN